ncbi:hypothetical protein EDC94DRAFT_620312 [Helicostylum pulchrum]|nr:hypothetical protein EDC94DRAFT_620312 [Helicostylum pulchrum]
MKSWFNLTRPFFQVQVTDDWFPISLAAGALNKTWQFNVSIVPHYLEELGDSFPIQFSVVQSTPKPLLVMSREHLAHKWILLIIIIVSLLVMIAICIIVWLWKNMQKMKKTSRHVDHTMQSSILSTPDAIMIADTFRQVLSTSDINKSRTDVANHLLEKQLKSEGTSVLEVERRTSSRKNF